MKNKSLKVLNFVLIFVATLFAFFGVMQGFVNQAPILAQTNESREVYVNSADTFISAINNLQENDIILLESDVDLSDDSSIDLLVINKNFTIKPSSELTTIPTITFDSVLFNIEDGTNVVIQDTTFINLSFEVFSSNLTLEGVTFDYNDNFSVSGFINAYNKSTIELKESPTDSSRGSIVPELIDNYSIYIDETSLLKMDSKCKVEGDVIVHSNLNPIWLSSSLTGSLKVVNEFGPEFIEGTAIAFVEGATQDQAKTIADQITLYEYDDEGNKVTPPHLLLVPKDTEGGYAIVVDRAEVKYKLSTDTDYTYSSFANMLSALDDKNGTWDIVLLEDVEHDATSLGSDTIVLGDGGDAVTFTTESDKSLSIASDIEIGALGNLSLGGGITLNIENTLGLQVAGVLTMNGSSTILNENGYGVYLAGSSNGGNIVLNWSLINGSISGSTADFYIANWGSSTPITISSSKGISSFTIDGVAPTLSATNTYKTVVQKSSSVSLDLSSCFTIYEGTTTLLKNNGWRLLQDGNNLNLTNYYNVSVHYGDSDDEVYTTQVKYGEDFDLTTNASSYKPAGFKIEGYTLSATAFKSTATKLSVLENNTVTITSDVNYYAVYSQTINITGALKGATKTFVIATTYYNYTESDPKKYTLAGLTDAEKQWGAYTFVNWSSKKITSLADGGEITLSSIGSDGVYSETLTANWTITLTLKYIESGYDIDNGVTMPDDFTETLNYSDGNVQNEKTISSGLAKLYDIGNYVFMGWSEDQTATKNQNSFTFSGLKDSGATSKDVYAVWYTYYIVNHHKQEIVNNQVNGYGLCESETIKNVVIGTSHAPTLESYDGFVTPTINKQTIGESGYTFDVYYDRATYNITYDASASDYIKTDLQSGVYGITYTINIVKGKGEIKAYYTTQSDSDTKVSLTSNGSSLSFTMPYENITITAEGADISITNPNKSITYNPTTTQNVTFTGATSANDTYKHDIISGDDNNYFSIDGTTITVKAGTPVGTYNLTVSATGNKFGGYCEGTVTIKVTPATLTYTGTIFDKTEHNANFNGASQSITPQGTVSLLAGDTINTIREDSVIKNSAGVEVGEAINVGSYTFTYTYSAPNYNDLILEATLNINAINANLSVSINTSSYTYGVTWADIFGNITKSAKGVGDSTLTGGTWKFYVDGTEVSETSQEKPNAKNGYKITLEYTPSSDESNYKKATSTALFINITKATSTLSIAIKDDTKTYTYGVTWQDVLNNYTIERSPAGKLTYKANGEDITNNLSGLPNAIEYTIAITFTPTDTLNYSAPESVEIKVKINKASITHSVTTKEITYGQTLIDAIASLTITGNNNAPLEIQGYAFEKGNGYTPTVSESGTYKLTITPKDSNYAEKPIEVDIVVNKVAPTLDSSIQTTFTYSYGQLWEDIYTFITTYLNGLEFKNPNNQNKVQVGYTLNPASQMGIPTIGEYEIGLTFSVTNTANYNAPQGETIKVIISSETISVSTNLTNLTSNAPSTYAPNANPLVITLTASNGYELPSKDGITITINGAKLTGFTYESGEITIPGSYINGDVSITASGVDKTNPTVTLEAKDYNTFTITATDAVGVTHYAITTTNEEPIDWTTISSTTEFIQDYDIGAEGTYYVWVKDNQGLTASDSIIAYTISVQESSNLVENVYVSDVDTLLETNNKASIVALNGTKVYLYATLKAENSDGSNTITFTGWGGDLTGNPQAVEVTETTTYTATATETINSANYTVKHLFQDLLLNGYNVDETKTQTLSGIIGSVTKAQALSVDGFTAQTITQQVINKEGTTEVVVYYDRETYTLTNTMGTGTTLTIACDNGAHEIESTLYYGLSYTLEASLQTGYNGLVVKFNGTTITLTQNEYTFTANQNVEIITSATANELTFNGKDFGKIVYNPTSYDSKGFTGASNGSGGYTYEITSVTKNDESFDNTNEAFTLSGTSIQVKGGTSVGIYVVTISVTDNNTSATTIAEFTIEIIQAQMTHNIVLSDSLKTYTGSALEITPTGSVTTPSGITPSVEITQGENVVSEAINVGSYTFTYTYSAENYESFSVSATLTITKAQMTHTIALSDSSQTYTGSALTITPTGSVTTPSGIIPSVEIVAKEGSSLTNGEAINVGEYTFTYTYSAENYESFSVSATLTIDKASITPSVTTKEITYGQTLEDAISITATSDVTGSDIGIDYAFEKGNGYTPTVSESGTYKLTITPKDSNYAEKPIEVEVTVNRKQENISKIVVEGIDFAETIEIEITPTIENDVTFGVTGIGENSNDLSASNLKLKNDGTTYLFASFENDTITIVCTNAFSGNKIVYYSAQSDNYTFTGYIEITGFNKINYTTNAELKESYEREFNGNNQIDVVALKKIDTSKDYFAQMIVYTDGEGIALGEFKETEVNYTCNYNEIINAGTYAVTYSLSETDNYNASSISTIFTITQAQLNAPTELGWNKGVASFIGSTTTIAGIDITYSLELFKGTESQNTFTSFTYNKQTGVYSLDLTSALKTNLAGDYTFKVTVISSDLDNCANSSAVESSKQYVSEVTFSCSNLESIERLSITDSLNNTISLNDGEINGTLYVINGETLNASTTLKSGYVFNGWTAGDNLSITTSTSLNTTMQLLTSAQGEDITITIESALDEFTIAVDIDLNTTLYYKQKESENWSQITDESLPLQTHTNYEFKFEINKGYKVQNCSFSTGFVFDAESGCYEINKNNITQESITITTTNITYTINTAPNNSDYGNAYISTSENFESKLTQIEVNPNNEQGYLNAIISDILTYKFSSFSVQDGYAGFITIGEETIDGNSTTAPFTVNIIGNEDIEFTITANFESVENYTITYNFIVMDTEGNYQQKSSQTKAYNKSVREISKANFEAGTIDSYIYSILSDFAIDEGTSLVKITNGAEIIWDLASETALENLTIANTDGTIIAFYFERAKYSVTINYKENISETKEIFHGASVTLPTDTTYTQEGFTIIFVYNYTGKPEDVKRTQTNTFTLSGWKLNGTLLQEIPTTYVVTQDLAFEANYTESKGKISLPTENISRTGYDFLGWLENNNDTGSALNDTFEPTQNQTYYAGWQLNDIQSIYIDGYNTTDITETYKASEYNFNIMYTHSLNGLTAIYKWGEEEKQTLTLTNAQEATNYTVSVTLTDSDNRTTQKTQNVSITILKADLNLSVFVEVDGTNYNYNVLYAALQTGKIKLYTTSPLPTLVYSGNSASLVNSINWKDTSLIAGESEYEYTITPKDTSNYNTQTGSFKLIVNALKVSYIEASFNQGDVKIYSNEGGKNLQNLKYKKNNNTYILQIVVHYNDSTTKIIDFINDSNAVEHDEFDKVSLSIKGDSEYTFDKVLGANNEASTQMQVKYTLIEGDAGYTLEGKEFTDEVIITVTAKQEDHLLITNNTNYPGFDENGFKKNYFAGETFITDTIVVTLVYNNGDEEVLSTDRYEIVYEKGSCLNAGDTSVQVVYKQNRSINEVISGLNVSKITLDENDELIKDLQTEYEFTYGEKLGDILSSLENLTINETINENEILNVGSHTYSFKYNPDSSIYNDYSPINITISVVKSNFEGLSVTGGTFAFEETLGAKKYAVANLSNLQNATSLTIYYSTEQLTNENYTSAPHQLTIESVGEYNLENIFVEKADDGEKTVYYYVVINQDGVDTQNYNDISGSVTIKVTGAKQVTVEFNNNITLTYGENASVTITANDIDKNNITLADNNVSLSVSGTSVLQASYSNGKITITPLKANSSSVNITIKILNNTINGKEYNFESEYTLTVTNISKATRTISWTQDVYNEHTFNGASPSLNGLVSVTPTLQSGENVSFIYYAKYDNDVLSEKLNNAPTNAGTYYVVANVNESNNYFASTTNGVLTLTINPNSAAVVSAVIQKTFTYNGLYQTLNSTDLSVTIAGVVAPFEIRNSQNLKESITLSQLNAGTYNFAVVITDSNYAGSYATCTWEIKKFTNSQKANIYYNGLSVQPTLTYNGQNQSFDNLSLQITFDGGNTESLDLSSFENYFDVTSGAQDNTNYVLYKNAKNAGSGAKFDINVFTQNIDFTILNTSFTINQKEIGELDFTFVYKEEEIYNNHEIVWDGASHTITAKFEDGVLIAGDNVLLTLAGASYKDEGNYTLTVVGLSGASASNYKLTTSAKNKTLNWSIVRYFNVTFNATQNGGALKPTAPLVLRRANKTLIDLLEYSDVAVKEGYEFIGWSQNPNAKKETISSITIEGEDIELFANYKKEMIVTLIYLNANSQIKEEPLTAICYNNETSVTNFSIASVYTLAQNDVPSGYKFLQFGETKEYQITVTQNVTLKAYYTKTISLTKIIGNKQEIDSKDATYFLNNNNELTLSEEVVFTLTAPPIKKSDGKFVGWAKKLEDGSLEKLYNQEELILSENFVIYALVEVTVNYSGFIIGIVIFFIILLILIIILIVTNNRKRKRRINPNLNNIELNENEINFDELYKSKPSHERINDSRKKQKELNLDEFSPLIKNEVKKEPPTNSISEKNNAHEKSNDKSEIKVSSNELEIKQNNEENDLNKNSSLQNENLEKNKSSSSNSDDIQSILDKYANKNNKPE